jgi:alpha-glucosidase
MNEPANFCDWPCDVPENFITPSWIHAPPPMNISNALKPLSLQAFPAAFQSPISSLSRNHDPGSKKGLAGRDLINPKYAIHNAGGSLSNHTLNTDLIHSNGLAEYDTHNL